MPFLVWVKIIVSEKSSCEKSVTATTREVRMPSIEVKADVCHTPTIAQGNLSIIKQEFSVEM